MTKSEAKAIEQRSLKCITTLNDLFKAVVPAEIRDDPERSRAYWKEHFEPFSNAVTEVHEMATAELDK